MIKFYFYLYILFIFMKISILNNIIIAAPSQDEFINGTRRAPKRPKFRAI
ncbi:MAG: hypothetical protein Q8807_02295 ['Waltheria sp.' little leaf phytoplasma]|nr:hypothetical protein ['Waltheria sp.' little leaf phytoplasma]